MTLRKIFSGITYLIQSAGSSVQVCDITFQVDNVPMNELGGVIINPLDSKDQGLHNTESLFVSLLGPARTTVSVGTVEVVPGQWFLVPPGANAWVNAKSAGHRFTSYFSSNFRPPLPPLVVPGQPESGLPALGAEPGARPFPPHDVTGLTTVIPSYLYQEYTDDDDLQGFVESQNEMQQNYVDTFNALNLPIYTGPIVTGALLDWVGRGLYGIGRPVIGPEIQSTFGPLNTYGCNWLVPMWDTFTASMNVVFGLNIFEHYDFENLILTNDDVYRRVISWHFFKQDSKYFSIEFLKRRVWRFLYGVDGKHWDFIDPTLGAAHPANRWPGSVADPDDAFIADRRQISITMGVNRSVCIRFVLGDRPVDGGALPNFVGCNGFNPLFGAIPTGRPGPWEIGDDPVNAPDWGITLNDLETTFTPLPKLPMMKTFKEALDLGVLEVPYQFDFSCKIG
jgi:hypothetical protein